MKRTLKVSLLSAALAFTFSSPLMATEATSVSDVRDQVARSIATLVNDPAFEAAVQDKLSKNKAALADVVRQYAADATARNQGVVDELRDLERQAIHLRGLDGAIDNVIDLRVLGGSAQDSAANVHGTWVGTVVKDQATGTKQLVAYGPSGEKQQFSADQAPGVPMLLVESDSTRSTQAGMQVMNEALRREGAQTPRTQPMSRSALRSSLRSSARDVSRLAPTTLSRFAPPSVENLAVPETEELTILSEIWLADDREPNTAFDAEIFAVITGISPEGKVQVITKDMPWLDHDKFWYKPGMDLINWKDFGPSYVNVQLFEDDGDTNFKNLASAVTSAVGDVSLLVSPTAPQALVISGVSKIASKVLDAMDSKWFQNDADYIDSFYVIERGGNYGTHDAPLVGARGWAKMVLKPYQVKNRVFKETVNKTP